MSDNQFPKENRLVDEREFSRVYTKGLRCDGGSFVFYMLEKDESRPRIGIVTPKYLGSATTRNHIKRVIRENFRKNKEIFAGFDFIVRPKESAGRLSNTELGDRFINDFRASEKVVENGY